MSNETIYAIICVLYGIVLMVCCYEGFYEHKQFYAIIACVIIGMIYMDKMYAAKSSILMGLIIGLRGHQ